MQIMTVGSWGAWYVRLLTVTAGIRALSLLWRICLTSVPAPCRYGCSHNNMPLCPLGLALYAYAPALCVCESYAIRAVRGNNTAAAVPGLRRGEQQERGTSGRYLPSPSGLR